MPVGFATAVLPGLTTLTVAVNVTAWPYTVGRARRRDRGARIRLVDHLGHGRRSRAGNEVGVAAGVRRGDRMAGRAERGDGQARLVLAADDASVPVPIAVPPS